MKAQRTIDRDKAPIPFAAVLNARMLNIENESLYTQQQRTKVIAMMHALELVYKAAAFHINYRKRFIAIKIDDAQIWKRKDLRALEATWGDDVVKIFTKQGIIYRKSFAQPVL
jgi:hypothetical protein